MKDFCGHGCYLDFFTDPIIKNSNYCLLNVSGYNSVDISRKRVVFIDPGVKQLINNCEYRNIDFLHDLVGRLRWNEFISIDYPCDMNPAMGDEFIEKSIKNNLKYKDNEKYICTVQSKFMDFKDFKDQFEYLEGSVDFKRKIIGIGNMCVISRANEFTDRVFEFLVKKHWSCGYRFHFYGLGLNLIRKYINRFYFCSVDSTKWIYAVNKDLKRKYGLLIGGTINKNANMTEKRYRFFMEYIKELQRITANLQY